MKKSTVFKTPQPSVAPAASADAGYTRLHIAPFDPQLLRVIVPSAILPNARHISYHTLQTFPDRPYGFIDLPSIDADKIKKKLNGAVLKGSKIRIEPARPDNMPNPSADAIMDPIDSSIGADGKDKKSKSSKKDKKRKRDAQEMSGIELEEGRKVKRGWTVTPEEAVLKKKKEKEKEKLGKSRKKEKKTRREPESKYSEVPECLVKTRLPPNKLDMVDDSSAADKKKSKKGKKQEIVVHEFERNTKFASFLKAAPGNTVSGKEGTSFIEGKGWVDDSGTVVEELKSTRPKSFPKLQVSMAQASSKDTAKDDDTSSSSSSSSGSSSDDQSQHSESPEKQATEVAIAPGSPVIEPESESDSVRPRSSGSLKSLTIRIPPATPSSANVHPLETLYKRQQQGVSTTQENTAHPEPFTFFGAASISDVEDDSDGMGDAGNEEMEVDDDTGHPQTPQVPMTPFTQKDFEWRNVRSAAPTPDTAHPSRASRLWPRGNDGNEVLDNLEEEDEADTGIAAQGSDGDGDYKNNGDDGGAPTNPNTDFQKWFWEHRGDLNRSWRKRRKMSAKEKRYRENRARADKAI